MRNVLFFVLMLSSIVILSANAKKNRQDDVPSFKKGVKNYVEDVKNLDLKMVYIKGGSFIIGNTSAEGG